MTSLRRVSTDELVQSLSQETHRLEIVKDASADDPLDNERIRELDLDFILGFAEPERLERYRRMARLGIWWFSELQGESLSRGVPFFDSILRRQHIVQVSFRDHSTDEDSPSLLWRGCYGIDPNSPGHDLERVLGDLSRWPLWVCGRMHCGSHHLQAGKRPVDGNAFQPRARLGTTLKWPVKLLWGKVTRKVVQMLLRPQWNVAVLKRPIHTLLSEPVADDAQFLDIGPGTETFWADPSGVAGDGILTILFEQFDYDSEKGNISFLRVTDRGVQEKPSTVFEDLYHMSYPFIFKDEEDIFCVPESGRAGKIEIHRAVQFPEIWERIAEVGESVSGIDSTVFRYNGLWWLACTMLEHEPNTNLFLYYAERLTGPWSPHRCNPVKTDVRSSRPAGTPFVHEGELYRPSQDCSQSYGGRVCINRVLRLDPSEFVEEEVCAIEPAPKGGYPDGLHTISAVGNWTLIDGLRHRLTWKGAARSVRRKCRTLGALTERLRSRPLP